MVSLLIYQDKTVLQSYMPAIQVWFMVLEKVGVPMARGTRLWFTPFLAEFQVNSTMTESKLLELQLQSATRAAVPGCDLPPAG